MGVGTASSFDYSERSCISLGWTHIVNSLLEIARREIQGHMVGVFLTR